MFDDRLGVGFLGDIAGVVVVFTPAQSGTEKILGEVRVTSSRSRLLASAEEGFAERYGLGVGEAEDGLGVAGTRGGVLFLSDCVREDVPSVSHPKHISWLSRWGGCRSWTCAV